MSIRAYAGLSVLFGPDPDAFGRFVPLFESIYVGRVTGNVVLADPAVSPLHFALRWAGGASVTDMGSWNGTFVDGRRAGIETPCPFDSVLRCGNTLLWLSSPETPRRHAVDRLAAAQQLQAFAAREGCAVGTMFAEAMLLERWSSAQELESALGEALSRARVLGAAASRARLGAESLAPELARA